MKFFQVYQYAAPLILLPISYGLWLGRYSGDHRMVLLTLSLPIAFAYVIPGLGTNWLRLWEFNTRFRLGRFRPHHGLVFGTATSLIAFAALAAPDTHNAATILRRGFVLGSVLAFWNWLYDIYAIKAGFIRVYTKIQVDGGGAEAVATNYAPILFGTFGFCYGIALGSYEQLLLHERRWHLLWLLLVVGQVVCLAAPVLAYVSVSFLRTGQSGLQSYERLSQEK